MSHPASAVYHSLPLLPRSPLLSLYLCAFSLSRSLVLLTSPPLLRPSFLFPPKTILPHLVANLYTPWHFVLLRFQPPRDLWPFEFFSPISASLNLDFFSHIGYQNILKIFIFLFFLDSTYVILLISYCRTKKIMFVREAYNSTWLQCRARCRVKIDLMCVQSKSNVDSM